MMMISRKFVRFVVPALFTAAICSLGASDVYATVSCAYFNHGKTARCFTFDDDDPKDSGQLWLCSKHKDGTWSCTMAKTEGNLPPNLKDGISNAQAAAAKQQTSKQ
jgi:hypothetical protein